MGYSYIGKNIPRVDGLDKVTGVAIYSTDIKLPGVLVGKIKRSPYPFARILSIDVDRARRLPAVKAVITASDVTQFPYGPFIADELPLADRYARFAGDQVAAVAATDADAAEEALDLIKVEYEELPSVLDPTAAMQVGAPAVHPEREEAKQNTAYHIDFVRGEGEAALKRADVVIEDRFSTHAQHQAYLEPQACVAHWESSGKLTIWASLQAPFRARSLLAKALGIPEHQIRVVQPYVGGGFGGKNYSHPHLPISALLSRNSGRPVQIVYTREEDFTAGRPRISEIIDLKIGFKKDGTIVAKSVKLTADCGAYAWACPNIVASSLTNPDTVYRQANIQASANLVYTNKIPRSACRGYGSSEMLFAIESLMDCAAERLGIDPVELRLKNCSQQGDVTVHGGILNSCGLGESIRQAAAKSEWKTRRQKKEANHGFGIACQAHYSGQRGMNRLYDGSAAFVHVDQYGKVRVISGESEIGPGALTVFAQIAAEELGVSLQDVEVMPFVDTDISPACIGTSASRATTLGGNGVRMAARDARNQLLKHAAKKLGIGAEELEIRFSKFYRKGSTEEVATVAEVAYDTVLKLQAGMPITGRGEYRVPDYVVLPDKTRYGNTSIAYAFGAQIAEVTVDRDTGKVDVLNVWVGEDIGKAINPKMVEGQIEGGVVQGAGYALSEQYIWEDGKILNPNFTDYKIPICISAPEIHSILIETNEPAGPFGGKSIGEAAMNATAAAIANAVYDAVGVRIKNLPLTPEKVLRALREKNRRQ